MKTPETDNGGPAFPAPDDYTREGLPIYGPKALQGMSLRDYFAAKALDGLMSSHIVDEEEGAQLLAEDCYKVADAFLAVRRLPSRQ